MAATEETTFDVIVIGSGAAGLAAASMLARAGLSPVVLEACDRPFGRVHTVRPAGWPIAVELGAEFLHGDPDSVRWLTQRAGARMVSGAEGSWGLEGGKLAPEDRQGGGLDPHGVLTLASDVDEEDRTAAEVIARAENAGTVTAEEAATLRGYVEGFYAAPVDQMSARALAKEETGSGASRGAHRWLDGYDRLLEPLLHDAEVRFDHVVTKVRWRKGGVAVHTRSRAGFVRTTLRARFVVVTVSIGVLQAEPGAEAAVVFEPPLPAETRSALDGFRMGHVERVVLRFREPFWLEPALYAGGARPEALGYVRTNGGAWPRFWSLAPVRVPVLVGWAGGPAADHLAQLDEPARIEAAIASLALAFPIARGEIERRLDAWHLSRLAARPLHALAPTPIPASATRTPPSASASPSRILCTSQARRPTRLTPAPSTAPSRPASAPPCRSSRSSAARLPAHEGGDSGAGIDPRRRATSTSSASAPSVSRVAASPRSPPASACASRR